MFCLKGHIFNVYHINSNLAFVYLYFFQYFRSLFACHCFIPYLLLHSLFVFPVQTQMQSIRSVHYHGLHDAFTTIVHKEGVRRLLRGMSAMVLGAGPAHAMYFACYEKTKQIFTVKINGHKFQNSSLANGRFTY